MPEKWCIFNFWADFINFTFEPKHKMFNFIRKSWISHLRGVKSGNMMSNLNRLIITHVKTFLQKQLSFMISISRICYWPMFQTSTPTYPCDLTNTLRTNCNRLKLVHVDSARCDACATHALRCRKFNLWVSVTVVVPPGNKGRGHPVTTADHDCHIVNEPTQWCRALKSKHTVWFTGGISALRDGGQWMGPKIWHA